MQNPLLLFVVRLALLSAAASVSLTLALPALICLGVFSGFVLFVLLAAGRCEAARFLLLLPFFSSSFGALLDPSLLLVIALVALIIHLRDAVGGLRVGFPIIFVAGCWTAFELWEVVPWGLLIVQSDAIPLRSILSVPAFHTLQSFLRLFCLIGMFGVLCNDALRRDALSAAFKGLPIGIIISALQFFGYLHGNQNPIWESLGRSPLSFTDPNAAGMYAALLLPLAWAAKRAGDFDITTWLSAAALFCVGIGSGSRSFILALCLYLAVLAWSRRPLYLLWGVVGAAVSVMIINYMAARYPRDFEAIHHASPQSVARVLETVNLTTSGAALFSRITFTRMSVAAFRDHSLTGVGYERFKYIAPVIASKLNLGTGLWSDNPNNFYLGILAELGLIGALALLLFVGSLRAKRHPEPVARAALYVMLILLLTGPHLVFNEIMLLFALTLASCVKPTLRLYAVILRPVVILFAIAAIYSHRHESPVGFYAFEHGADTPVRWTGPYAVQRLECRKPSGDETLTISAMTPGQDDPVWCVDVESEQGAQLTQQCGKNGKHSITFQCPAAARRTLKIAARGWVPDLNGYPGDRRLVGIQVEGMRD